MLLYESRCAATDWLEKRGLINSHFYSAPGSPPPGPHNSALHDPGEGAETPEKGTACMHYTVPRSCRGPPPAEEAVQTSAALCRKSGSYPGPSNRADVVAVALRTSILSPEYGGSSVWQGEHVVAAGVRGLKGLGLLSWDLSQGVEGEGVCFKSSPLNPYISLHGPRRNPLFQPCVIPSKPQALSPNCSEKNLFCCLLSCPSLRHVSTELPLPDGSGLEAHHHPRYQQRLQQLREPRRGLD